MVTPADRAERLPTAYEVRRAEAHALLNAARAGLRVTSQQITQALVLTGDLTPEEARDYPAQVVRSAGSWQAPRARFARRAQPFDGLGAGA